MYLKVLKSIYTCTYIIYVFYSINIYIYIIYTYATPGHQGLNNHAYFPCLVCSENNQNSSFPRTTGYQCAVHGVVLVACWDLLNLHWRENCTTSIPFYMCVKMSCFCLPVMYTRTNTIRRPCHIVGYGFCLFHVCDPSPPPAPSPLVNIHTAAVWW